VHCYKAAGFGTAARGGVVVVLLRVGSEFLADGIENSIVCNCVLVNEVIVFSCFFVNVKLFHCV
jgi:hypothetical protein